VNWKTLCIFVIAKNVCVVFAVLVKDTVKGDCKRGEVMEIGGRGINRGDIGC